MDLSANYLREELHKYLKPEHRIVNVAFSFRDTQVQSLDDWNTLYSKETGIFYDGIVDSFAEIGIPEENMTFVNYYTDTKETAAKKIRNADIVYFPGGLPDRMMDRIIEFDLQDVLLQHTGIIMGFSAGALIQLDEYDLSPDKDYPEFGYYKGLPYLRDFYLEVHYEGTAVQDSAIQQVLIERRKPVYATAHNNGAIIVDGGKIKLLGDVKKFEPYQI